MPVDDPLAYRPIITRTRGRQNTPPVPSRTSAPLLRPGAEKGIGALTDPWKADIIHLIAKQFAQYRNLQALVPVIPAGIQSDEY